MLISKHKEYFMRVNPISQQNNQSFRAINMKYYKQAVKWLDACGWVSNDIYCRLRYDIMLWKEIPVQDGIDTLNAIKRLFKHTDSMLERDLKNYNNMLKENKPNQ